MAEHVHTTSRRRLLAGAPAALALSGVAALPPGPPNLDADLIALCAAYVSQARAFCAVGQHTHDMLCSDPEWIRCHELACAMVPEMHRLEAEVTDTPARTVEGLLAKAEATRHQLSGDADRDTSPMDPGNALAWSLVQETLAVLGRA